MANMKVLDYDQQNEWDELWLMKWKRWTLVCGHSKDRVVVKQCSNTKTTEVEYKNINKMTEQDGYT